MDWEPSLSGNDVDIEINHNATALSTGLEANAQQNNAPGDLTMISWPEDQNFPGARDGLPYYYDESRGEGVYIYVIDEGVDVTHRVSGEPTGREIYLSIAGVYQHASSSSSTRLDHCGRQ